MAAISSKKPPDVDKKFWEALVKAADDVVEGGNLRSHVRKLMRQFPGSDEEDIVSTIGSLMDNQANSLTAANVADEAGTYHKFTGKIDFHGTKGDVRNATFRLNDDGGYEAPLHWENGIWKGGVWETGVFENGVWKGGVWEGGDFENGVWEDGVWEDGIFRGRWKGGLWKFGDWASKEIHPDER